MSGQYNAIEIFIPCDKFELVSLLIPELDDKCYTPPLKRGDKMVALSGSGRVSDNTLEQIMTQISEGVFKENTIHFYLLDSLRQVIDRTEFSPDMIEFDRDRVLEAMDLDMGVSGIDCLEDAVDSTEQDEPLILSMLGEITIISKEAVEE